MQFRRAESELNDQHCSLKVVDNRTSGAERLSFDWFRTREAERLSRRGKVLSIFHGASCFATHVGKVTVALGLLGFPAAIVIGFVRPPADPGFLFDVCIAGLGVASLGGLLWAMTLYSSTQLLYRVRDEYEAAEGMLKEHIALNVPQPEIRDDSL